MAKILVITTAQSFMHKLVTEAHRVVKTLSIERVVIIESITIVVNTVKMQCGWDFQKPQMCLRFLKYFLIHWICLITIYVNPHHKKNPI